MINKLYICSCLSVLFSGLVTFPSFASHQVWLGTDQANLLGGGLLFDVNAYLYYNSNTSTQLDIDAMLISGVNRGDRSLDKILFEASEGNFNKSITTNTGISPVSTNEPYRIEVDWNGICSLEGENTVFNKNGPENTVYTDISIGYSELGLAGFETFWYPTGKPQSSFHQ